MRLFGAAGEHRLESLRLSAEGYELKVDAPVTVRVEPRRLVVCMCSAGQDSCQRNRFLLPQLVTALGNPA